MTVALGVDDFGGVGAMLPAIIARNVTVLGDWTRDIFLLLDVTTTREALEQDPDNSRIMVRAPPWPGTHTHCEVTVHENRR